MIQDRDISAVDILLRTVELRPYVFAFLAVYILGSWAQFGIRSTLAFLVVGYIVAFLSEFSSIHTGFPYGNYFYIPTTVNEELWVLGVPFMDSISYVFLAACSYSTALFFLAPLARVKGGYWLLEPRLGIQLHVIAATGGLLMVLLDVIIDPVALRGQRWFLGQIFGYEAKGGYFGVPFSNFAGWALVGWLLMGCHLALRTLLEGSGRNCRWPLFSWSAAWGPALYICVIAFNLTVTFWIGETTLALCSSIIAGIVLVFGGALLFYRLLHPLADPP